MIYENFYHYFRVVNRITIGFIKGTLCYSGRLPYNSRTYLNFVFVVLFFTCSVIFIPVKQLDKFQMNQCFPLKKFAFEI